jgi:nucleoid-associated protein YgaU
MLVAGWLWGIAADAGQAAAGGAPVRADEVLTAVVASAAFAGTAWLALGTLLELLSLVPGVIGSAARRVTDLITPRLLRRLVGAVLGVGLAAGVLPGASVARSTGVVHVAPSPPDPAFAPLPDPGWSAPADPPRTAPGRGWVPRPPVVRAHPDVRVLSPAPPAGRHGDAPVEVVVRRGDSLWSIAAQHLGPDASDAQIARAWPAWFESNRGVIGDDPDLLRPGQVLHAPDSVQS